MYIWRINKKTEMNLTTLFSQEMENVMLETFKKIIKEAAIQLAEENSKPLSRKEAARFLGVDESSLNRYELQGILKFHYLGGKKLYLKSELISAIIQS
jgi:hypothetical protein